MNSVCAKTALVPLILAATWATAHADATLTATLTPPSLAGKIDHVRLFAEDYTPSNYNIFTGVQDPPGVYIEGSTVLSADFGSVISPSTLTSSTTVAYAAGTSAYAGIVGTVGTNGLFFSSNGLNETAANGYLGTGTNFSTLFDAIVNGSPAPLFSLYGNAETTNGNPPHGIALANFNPGAAYTQNFSTYLFTRASNGTVTNSTQFTNTGTLTVAPVPEPAPAAALTLGGLALLRRRRRLA